MQSINKKFIKSTKDKSNESENEYSHNHKAPFTVFYDAIGEGKSRKALNQFDRRQ